MHEHGIIPIWIRLDLIVRVQGIPHDLTRREADKICSVVQALVPVKQEG